MNPLKNLIGAALVGSTLVAPPLLRDSYNRWGATDAEVRQPLPGDELVPSPMLGYTRAITIQALPERVWPWMVQLGQGCGGLYSYDGLENLAGCDIHNVERILPELQDPQLGELIRLGQKGYPCFGVKSIEPVRSMILISTDPKTGQPVVYTDRRNKDYSIATWQFILQLLNQDVTRLLVRQRLSFSPDLKQVWRLTEPVGYVMAQKMLLGVRQWAERKQ